MAITHFMHGGGRSEDPDCFDPKHVFRSIAANRYSSPAALETSHAY